VIRKIADLLVPERVVANLPRFNGLWREKDDDKTTQRHALPYHDHLQNINVDLRGYISLPPQRIVTHTSATRLSIMLGGSIGIGGQTCPRRMSPSGLFKRARPGRRGSDCTTIRGHLGGAGGVLWVGCTRQQVRRQRCWYLVLVRTWLPPVWMFPAVHIFYIDSRIMWHCTTIHGMQTTVSLVLCTATHEKVWVCAP